MPSNPQLMKLHYAELQSQPVFDYAAYYSLTVSLTVSQGAVRACPLLRCQPVQHVLVFPWLLTRASPSRSWPSRARRLARHVCLAVDACVLLHRLARALLKRWQTLMAYDPAATIFYPLVCRTSVASPRATSSWLLNQCTLCPGVLLHVQPSCCRTLMGLGLERCHQCLS